MRSNRLLVLDRLKSDWNRLLIDFYDPISAIRFSRLDDSIRIPISISILNWILYQKSLIISIIGRI